MVTDPDVLADRYLAEQTGLSPDVIARLDATVIDAKERQDYAIWRDLVNGVRSTIQAGG